MNRYSTGIIIEKTKIPKGNLLYIFCTNSGLTKFIYPYKIKNLKLDTLNLISFQTKINKEYTFIKQYTVINYFENIRNSFYKKVLSQIILEIIRKTLPENHKENEIFKLTLSFLNYLDKSNNHNQIEKNFEKFINAFIQMLGYQINENLTIIEKIQKLEILTNVDINSKSLLEDTLKEEKNYVIKSNR